MTVAVQDVQGEGVPSGGEVHQVALGVPVIDGEAEEAEEGDQQERDEHDGLARLAAEAAVEELHQYSVLYTAWASSRMCPAIRFPIRGVSGTKL